MFWYTRKWGAFLFVTSASYMSLIQSRRYKTLLKDNSMGHLYEDFSHGISGPAWLPPRQHHKLVFLPLDRLEPSFLYYRNKNKTEYKSELLFLEAKWKISACKSAGPYASFNVESLWSLIIFSSIFLCFVFLAFWRLTAELMVTLENLNKPKPQLQKSGQSTHNWVEPHKTKLDFKLKTCAN